MPVILIELLKIIIPAVIQYGPKAVAEVQAMLAKKELTADDWDALRKYAPPYESYGIPQAGHAQMPPSLVGVPPISGRSDFGLMAFLAVASLAIIWLAKTAVEFYVSR
jgi:hypothetical protein